MTFTPFPLSAVHRATLRITVCLGLACLTASASGQAASGGQDTKRKIPEDKQVLAHESGVKYSILVPGKGSKKPALGDQAVLHFSEWLSDGVMIQSTFGTGQPMRVRVGDPKVPLGLTIAAQIVTKGGRVKITAPPARAYGARGVPGRIPPNSTMIYEVELVDFVYSPKEAAFTRGDAAKTKATSTGIKYEILREGTGNRPGTNDIAEIEFTTWNMQGQVITGTFAIGQTYKAPIQTYSHPFLKEVLPLMRTGSSWRVVAPSHLTVKEMTADTVWNVKLIDHQPSEAMPAGDPNRSTTTKSGLIYERLSEGNGDRPRHRFFCELEWDFWQSNGTYIAGSSISGKMPVVIGSALHKFLDESLKLMKVGDVMRVEVPSEMTSPRLLRFDTVWRLKLLKIKEPMPAPEFNLPKPEDLSTTKAGLKYKVLDRGDGKANPPRMGQRVTVHYVGWLVNGKLFDSTYDKGQPATFNLGEVIAGLNNGLKLMKPGDTFLFVIPSRMGFGSQGTPDGTIPPNSTLVYQVKLVSVGS